MTPIGTTDQALIGYWKETAWAVPPVGTTPLQLVRWTGESLKSQIQYEESKEITGDRNLKTIVPVDADGGGDITSQLSYGDFDDWFEAALAGTWTANVLKNGIVLRSFGLEKKVVDVTTPFFQRFDGQVIDTLKLSLKPGAIVMATWSFKGKTQTSPSPTTSMSSVAATAAGTNPLFSVCADITALNEGGSGISFVTGLELQTQQNLRTQKVVGTLGPAGVGLGPFKTTGTLRVYVQDKSLLDKFLARTNSSISAQIGTGASLKYVLSLGTVRYTDAQIVAGSWNADFEADLPFTAIKDATDLSELKLTRTP